MAQEDSTQKEKGFFEFLCSSKEFWLMIFALIIGISGGAWASIRLTRVSLLGVALSLSVTFLIGVRIILRTFHDIYLSPEAFANRAARKSGLSFKGEMICAIPIVLAGVADIYLIFN